MAGASRSAGLAVHRQCGDDRLGRRRALAAGLTDGLDTPARARWPLDPKAKRSGRGVKAEFRKKSPGRGGARTALAQVAATGGRETILWALEDEVVAAVNEIHENPVYLKGLKLDPAIRATSDFLRSGGSGRLAGW